MRYNFIKCMKELSRAMIHLIFDYYPTGGTNQCPPVGVMAGKKTSHERYHKKIENKDGIARARIWDLYLQSVYAPERVYDAITISNLSP